MDTSAQTYFAHIGHPELIAVEIGHPTIPAAAPRTTDGIKDAEQHLGARSLLAGVYR
jgi:hypothetical protein